ncbi:hypothetical protein IPM19_03105 [bacterium]|nr:MAG: hypothetical protein IPM19_03105 [bacterium]
MKQKTNKHLIEGLIALVLIIGLGWLVLRSRNASAPTETTNTQNSQQPATQTPAPTNTTPATNQLASNDSVAVSTQSDNTKVVYIDNVNLSKPGFVVITTEGPDDAVKVIGTSKLITAGEKQDLQITLSNHILDSSINYSVLLYQDNGDKVFNIKTDTLLTGKNSSATFIAK